MSSGDSGLASPPLVALTLGGIAFQGHYIDRS